MRAQAWVVAVMLGVLPGAGAQTETKEVISNGGLMHTLEAAAVMNEPYSAMQEQKMVQTLPDGSKVNKGSAHHAVMRDAAGRVRVEQVTVCRCKNTKTTTIRVYVLDPVARTLMTWSDEGEKSALLIKLPPEVPKRDVPVTVTDATGARSTRPQPVITTENLGSEMLGDVPVQVTKTTTIVPPGRSGNDSPITKTHEVWTSQEMKLVLKEQWDDPRTGVRTVELKELQRAEPNPAYFRAPKDYKVKDLKQTLAELEQKLAELQATM